MTLGESTEPHTRQDEICLTVNAVNEWDAVRKVSEALQWLARREP